MSIGHPKVESAKHVMHEAVDIHQGRLKSCDFDLFVDSATFTDLRCITSLGGNLSTVRTM